MDNPALTESQRLASLSLWFLILDPARIPTPEVLETLDPNDGRAAVDISCAAIALHWVFKTRCTGSVGVYLWSHFWPWVYFIHTHWEFLEGRFHGLKAQQDFYLSYGPCVGSFHDHSETFALMSSTPSFWSTIGKLWWFVTWGDVPGGRAGMLYDILRFVLDAQVPNHPERLDEIVEGAGGSVDDIGSLVTAYMRTVLQEPSQYTIGHVHCLISLIYRINSQWSTSSAPARATYGCQSCWNAGCFACWC
ncbi:hypothetical protein FB45DRAFT_906387 [Roridomyces roridus]|uniref:Uncharacterized protein n=1 Tax=Roridomyces roridus TaxID=1738132 RepID=A0AAD7C0X8_9AGAR|nr:hypothetical protein FB45DRAFT_906387 [Roridomyces roridus]